MLAPVGMRPPECLPPSFRWDSGGPCQTPPMRTESVRVTEVRVGDVIRDPRGGTAGGRSRSSVTAPVRRTTGQGIAGQCSRSSARRWTLLTLESSRILVRASTGSSSARTNKSCGDLWRSPKAGRLLCSNPDKSTCFAIVEGSRSRWTRRLPRMEHLGRCSITGANLRLTRRSTARTRTGAGGG